MSRRVTAAARFLALVLAALAGSGAPVRAGTGVGLEAVVPSGFDNGWAHADCSSFNGAASRVIFHAGDGVRLTLLLNRPLLDSAGRWNLGNENRIDGLSAAECVGEHRPCARATAGELAIEAASPTRLRGAFSLRFGDASRAGRFDVPVVGLTAVCG
ncbi:MAG: hypothetical protein ACK5TK_03470 [Betaproteobacteria bacterium]